MGGADLPGDPSVAPRSSLCSNLTSGMLQGPPDQPGAHSGPPPGHLPHSARGAECKPHEVTPLLEVLQTFPLHSELRPPSPQTRRAHLTGPAHLFRLPLAFGPCSLLSKHEASTSSFLPQGLCMCDPFLEGPFPPLLSTRPPSSSLSCLSLNVPSSKKPLA